MKQILKVSVTCQDERNCSKFRELLRNFIELDDSLTYDYHTLIRGLKLLYPNREIFINLMIG